ncbi:MAG: cell division topological specificity factor MinE [Clostridia bacterium]|nr:cell division topological specificity factor MinE [Clostridia bacterium]
MTGLFGRTKREAKRRLMCALERDRSACLTDKLCREIESVIKKYAKIDGNVEIKIIETERRRQFMSLGCYIEELH